MCMNPSPDLSSDPFALGLALMDEPHRMLHQTLGQLSAVSDADFPAAFERMLKQVCDHFKEEEQAMAESAFPGIACHRAQHAQALDALEYAWQRVKGGAIAEGREICGLFSEWLSAHITTMDRMLAAFIQHAEAQDVSCTPA